MRSQNYDKQGSNFRLTAGNQKNKKGEAVHETDLSHGDLQKVPNTVQKNPNDPSTAPPITSTMLSICMELVSMIVGNRICDAFKKSGPGVRKRS